MYTGTELAVTSGVSFSDVCGTVAYLKYKIRVFVRDCAICSHFVFDFMLFVC